MKVKIESTHIEKKVKTQKITNKKKSHAIVKKGKTLNIFVWNFSRIPYLDA